MEKSVYVLKASDGTTKIGVSQNPHKRMDTIRTASGKEIVDFYISPACKEFSQIERAALINFKEDALPGEWVTTNFETVKDFVSEKFKPYLPKANLLKILYGELAIATCVLVMNSDYIVNLLGDECLKQKLDTIKSELNDCSDELKKRLGW